MGMDADVIGVGPITQEIQNTRGLNYLDKEYVNLVEGTIITSTFFHCVTSEMSRELAKALCIENPYDFAKHRVDGWPLDKFDWDTIREIVENEQPEESATEEIECFKACHRAGWTLIYRPNY